MSTNKFNSSWNKHAEQPVEVVRFGRPFIATCLLSKRLLAINDPHQTRSRIRDTV